MNAIESIEVPVEVQREIENSKLQRAFEKATHPDSNVLAIGYKDASGHIVVTDVLTFNLPKFTRIELGELSRRLDMWASHYRGSRS